jgi:hypothetical protein
MRLQQFFEEVMKHFVSLASLVEEAQQGTSQEAGDFWAGTTTLINCPLPHILEATAEVLICAERGKHTIEKALRKGMPIMWKQCDVTLSTGQCFKAHQKKRTILETSKHYQFLG